MDPEFILATLFFLALFGGLAVFVGKKTTASHRETIDRAKQIIRILLPERILDDPRILSQPEVPERMLSFMAKQQVRDILNRGTINEVIVLPRVRKKDESRVPWIGGAISNAFLIASLTQVMYIMCIIEPATIVGVVFFFTYCAAYSIWRSCSIVPRQKAEMLLRRMTREEVQGALQLAKIRLTAPGKQTGEALRPPGAR